MVSDPLFLPKVNNDAIISILQILSDCNTKDQAMRRGAANTVYAEYSSPNASKMKIDNNSFAEDKDRSSDINESSSNTRLYSTYGTEFWSLAAITDELTISLLDTKAVFCMRNSNRKISEFSDPKYVEEANRCNSGSGVLRRLYEEQARYKIYRIPIYRPPPVFVVYLKHLNHRLKKELASLDKRSRDYVMKEAIGGIFEQVDKRFFLLSVKPLLQWRLE